MNDASQYLRLDPNYGSGWKELAQAVAETIDPAAISRIWLFSPMRREQREWGTAVVAGREDVGDLRVFTARYMMIVRGRERGRGKTHVEEVGSSPEQVVRDVLLGVQQRFGEAEPPVAIDPKSWYPDPDDESSSQG